MNLLLKRQNKAVNPSGGSGVFWNRSHLAAAGLPLALCANREVTNIGFVIGRMSATSPSLASGSDIIPSNRKSSWIVGILVLAALINGTQTVIWAFSIAQSTWLYSDVRQAVVVAVTLVPAMLTCCLFLTAAWLLFSGRNPLSGKPNFLASTVLFTAVYGPFCWAIVSSWWFLMPVLPGFVAGVFTKPMDNKVFFVIACGLDTALILVSLLVVCGRLRRGLLLSTVTALAISSLTSYAFYSHMRA